VATGHQAIRGNLRRGRSADTSSGISIATTDDVAYSSTHTAAGVLGQRAGRG